MCWSAILITGRVHISIWSENVWGQAAGGMCHKCTFQVSLDCIHCTALYTVKPSVTGLQAIAATPHTMKSHSAIILLTARHLEEACRSAVVSFVLRRGANTWDHTGPCSLPDAEAWRAQ